MTPEDRARPRSDAQLYYDVLKKIARDYMTPEQCARNCHKDGLQPEEMLAMSYENIQAEAERAIKGKRRPQS